MKKIVLNKWDGYEKYILNSNKKYVRKLASNDLRLFKL